MSPGQDGGPELESWCPRCPERLPADGECPQHGPQPPLWRPAVASYDELAVHLTRAAGLPTYLPWPLGPGWRVSDFGVVVDDGRPVATLAACSGATGPDGPVDVLVVTEERGVGLGARCASLPGADPGPGFGVGRPTARVRVDGQRVALWPVAPDRPDGADELDRSVVAGEVDGRWLWLVLLPASAVLLLTDEWLLRDVSREGPHLVSLPFAGPRPVW